MAYVDQFSAGKTEAFVEQVTMACLNAAIAIAAESSGTANHSNRANLAKAVANNPSLYGSLFALGVAQNLALTSVSVASLPADATVQNSVNALWNTYAGVI